MLILASSSPRRIQLLKELGFSFKIIRPKIKEKPLKGESPVQMVRRLARLKALNVLEKCKRHRYVVILAADTIVLSPRGRLLGKPDNSRDARRMLGLLQGRRHTVLTGYCLICVSRGHVLKDLTKVVRSGVVMRSLSTKDIQRYVSTGEGADKAGAYAVQGLGMGLIKKIFGSYTNVVGLPVCEVMMDLEKTVLKNKTE